MNNKFLVLIFLITLTVCGQNDSLNTSAITISEKDLSAIMSRIVEAKQKKLMAQKMLGNETLANKNTPEIVSNNLEIVKLNQDLEHLKKKLTNLESVKSFPAVDSDENSYLKNEIEDLEKKIVEMNKLSTKQKNNLNSKIIIEHETKLNKSTKVEEKKSPLSKSDSIYVPLIKVPVSESPSVNYIDSLVHIKNKIEVLQSEKTIKSASLSNYSLLSKKYSDYSLQLFFQNNSQSIDSSQNKNLNEVVKILKDHETIDVLIKGFASKKGSPIYNQNLSMHRTEAIKINLIENGIHPVRILTVYHGIDYTTITDEKARRVDISFIIRK